MEDDVVDVEGLVVGGDGTAVVLGEADAHDIGGDVQFFEVISDIFQNCLPGVTAAHSSQM